MNLYLIAQDVNNDWDTYDSAVVVAENEDQARRIHPRGDINWQGEGNKTGYYPWATRPDQVVVNRIGSTDVYTEPQVLCASFNAG